MKRIEFNRTITLVLLGLAQLLLLAALYVAQAETQWPRILDWGRDKAPVEEREGAGESDVILSASHRMGWYYAWDKLNSERHTPSEEVIAAFNFFLSHPPNPKDDTLYRSHEYRYHLDFIVRFLMKDRARQEFDSFPVYYEKQLQMRKEK